MVKTQNRSAILAFPLERGFTICETQKLCSAESTIFIVFSAKHSFAEINECKSKSINLPKIGGCLPTCQRFFFVAFFVFGGFWFFFLVWKKPQKGNCPAICFSCLCPQGPVFKCHISFLFCFVSWFSFCLPFQIPSFFFGFCPSTPFWKICFGFFCFCYLLHLPLFMFACFFQSNFPNIPFLKPKLLSFLTASLFFSCFRFVFMFYVSAFPFYVGFVLVCFYFVIVCLRLVLLSDNKNTASLQL